MSIGRLESWDESALACDPFEKKSPLHGAVADAMLATLAINRGARGPRDLNTSSLRIYVAQETPGRPAP